MTVTMEDLAAPTLVSDWHDAGAVNAVLLAVRSNAGRSATGRHSCA